LDFFQNLDGFSDETIRFIADNMDIMVIEKAHGRRSFGHTEAAIEADARRIKALNPNVKTIAYYNFAITFPDFMANRLVINFRDDFLMRNRRGNIYALSPARGAYYFNHTNADVRDFWTDTAAAMVSSPYVDGVFADHIAGTLRDHQRNINRFGDEIANRIEESVRQTFIELRRKVGPDSLVLYNGIKRSIPSDNPNWLHRGLGFLDYANGLLNEDFKWNTNPEQSQLMIEDMQNAAELGKIVLFNAWAPVQWNDPTFDNYSAEQLTAMASERITYPLAFFLIAAGEYSYFSYAWGWFEEHGRTEFYDEFNKTLGKPLAKAKQEGFIYTREFEHASVWLDVENREAKIDWR
jgi:hypothetical protein